MKKDEEKSPELPLTETAVSTQSQPETKPETALVEMPDESSFKLAQRKALALSKSELLPKIYQNNIPNCMIAMELATRTGMNELMVMQNLHIIQGRPSWSSSFAIAAINSSKRFKGQLNFKVEGEGDKLSCIAFAVGFDDCKYESPKITMQMAISEGWVSKSGSKWKTMPELMIRYRAAAFFSRLFCPELLLGMQTEDEVNDFTGSNEWNDLEFLKAMFKEKESVVPEVEKEHIQRIFDTKSEADYRKVYTLLSSL